MILFLIERILSPAGLLRQGRKVISEGEVIAHILGNTKKGDRIELIVQRRGKDIDISCRAR